QARGHWLGHATTRRHDIKITLDPVEQNAPGLAGITLELASGEATSLDRAPLDGHGRLARRRRHPRRRGEAGVAARSHLSSRPGPGETHGELTWRYEY